jgi:Na+/melibiose symporter-like transporter
LPAWGLLAGAAVLLAAFLARERRSASPVIDPALFRDRRFAWGTAATVAVSVALYVILFAVPQYLQSVLGDGPASAGLRLLPMMGGLLVAGGAAGPAVRAAGTRLTVAAGLALLAGGLVVLSQVHLATGYAVAAAGLALCGLGTGAAIGAAMDTVMAAAGGGEAGIGASVNSALRQVGGAIAVAVLGSVLSAGYARALDPALAALPAQDAATARASVTQAVQLAGRLPSGGPALRAAAGTAFLHGMSSVMLICVAVAVAAIPASLRYLPGRAVPGDAWHTRSSRAPSSARP